MKTKIEIKNRWTRKILFEFETENNSIKKTLEKAIQEHTDLIDANLREADLIDANLRGANLRDADLRDADLIDANLRGADLTGAELIGANLRDADLIDANLRGADLTGADLIGANLRDADLIGANLTGADLTGADLTGADLIGADLRDANLTGAIKIPMCCKWSFGITDNKIHIGCEKRTIEEWDAFFESDKVISTQRDTDEFKQIEAVYRGLKAYYQHLKQ